MYRPALLGLLALLTVPCSAAQMVQPAAESSFVNGVTHFYAPPVGPDFMQNSMMEGLVDTAMRESDFAYLNRKAQEYRIKQSRTARGEWTLDLFYDSFVVQHSDDPVVADGRYTAYENKVLDWAAKYPNEPAPHLVYAERLIRHGWLFRGYGTAGEVSAEGWTRFHDYIGRAQAYLLAHKAVAGVDPAWYVEMLQVALGNDWSSKDYDTLLSQAEMRFPDYTPIYYAATDHFLPQWGGDVDSLDRFVNDAVNRTKARSGTQMYARIYSAVVCDCNFTFADTRADWPRMRAAYDEIAARYPDPWVFDEQFYVACMVGDKPTASRALAKLGDEPRSPVWQAPGTFGACRAWTAAKDNAPSPLMRRAAAEEPVPAEQSLVEAFVIGCLELLRDFASVIGGLV
ncbi:MAG TPA: hypothetical protein VJ476_13505 [Rhizomicrobium sp.]|nr:hypothetical protein [Rhizomicrobium sp.]